MQQQTLSYMIMCSFFTGSIAMPQRSKNNKRATSGFSSPLTDRMSKWECSPGNEENCSPLATSSPVLFRRVKKRRSLNVSLDKLPKHEPSNNCKNRIADGSKNESAVLIDDSVIGQLFSNDISESRNESSVLIKDDSFISHINFEKLDQLSASGSSGIPPAPFSPLLFEEEEPPSKVSESQTSIIPPTQASLSSTLSSQPLVTRIQRQFKSEGE